MNIVPIVMIKNEELWIRHVVGALADIFQHVVVADTGSTDSTLQQIYNIKNIHLMTYGNLAPHEVGLCRGQMQAEAKEKFGATHVFLVDGDELYPRSYLRFLRDNPAPEDVLGGFTYGIECTELENGECWLFDVGVSRHALFSVDSKWRGVYPFESPDSFVAGDPRNYYWSSLDPSHHFFHIHQMKRSSRDEDVHLRRQKQFQFSMADHPEIKPAKFWLSSREAYYDA